MVAGLASITPASGFVGPVGALIIGFLSGLVCQWFVTFIKMKLRIDDSLDVFAVHGVGGALGTLLAAFLATEAFGGLGLAEGVTATGQFGVQLLGVVAVGVWSAVASFVILKLVAAVTPLRVGEQDELEGLDIVAHGESGYEL